MSFICNEIYSKPFLEKVRKLSERYLPYKIGNHPSQKLKQRLTFQLCVSLTLLHFFFHKYKSALFFRPAIIS